MARSRGSTSEAPPAARSDAYTGLLFIALIAQIAGAAFFFMDWSQYPKSKPTPVPKQASPAPQAPAGGQQGGQVGAQQGAQTGVQVGAQQGAQQGAQAGAQQGGMAGAAGMGGGKGP